MMQVVEVVMSGTVIVLPVSRLVLESLMPCGTFLENILASNYMNNCNFILAKQWYGVVANACVNRVVSAL